MATYDLTSGSTAGKGASSIAAYSSRFQANSMRVLEATLDIDKMVADGYVFASGDVFQALEIPADTFVLAVGVEVVKAFDGTSPVVDVDFAAGDDIVDGGDVSSTGWLAAGTNGQGFSSSGTITFTQLVTTTDTIDVVLSAGAADVTAGRLRIVALVASVEEQGRVEPTEVTRDQLA